MNEAAFLEARHAFAGRLARLATSATRTGQFTVDDELLAIEGALTGTEDLTGILINSLPADDLRIRKCMVRVGHVLGDLPTAPLFGSVEPSVLQRYRRYEIVAALASSSGLPDVLLDGDKRAEYRFDAESNYFQARNIHQLNEQYITVWCRRLLAPYRLKIMCLFGPRGRTTEDLLRKELLRVRH